MNKNEVEKFYGGIIGIQLISYMFVYFVFLLALYFVLSKTKMFKFLFILFLIKQ